MTSMKRRVITDVRRGEFTIPRDLIQDLPITLTKSTHLRCRIVRKEHLERCPGIVVARILVAHGVTVFNLFLQNARQVMNCLEDETTMVPEFRNFGILIYTITKIEGHCLGAF